ncbi:MAG: hypothetical protein IPG71_03305 [bacterium]|nr:hypothetical protein [bacterium]
MSFVRQGRSFRGKRNTRNTIPESPDGYIVQVHFAGRPGTNKRIMNALRREVAQYTDDLKMNNSLLASGRYLSSVGGMWLLKVKTLVDAEKIAREYPPVKRDLLTFRLNVLVDSDGSLLRASALDRGRVDLSPA